MPLLGLPMMMQHHKPGHLRLHYFNARGRAEVIRWMLALGKADWEDVRYTMEQWPAVKPNMPLGQLPVLEGDCHGEMKKLCQSASIIHAVAHWFEFNGKTPKECIEADEAYEVLREIFELAGLIFKEQDPARKLLLAARMKEDLCPRNYMFLEMKLKTNGGKHLAGGEGFTYADIAWAVQFEAWRMTAPPEDIAEAAPKLPGLFALAKHVEEQPEIKAWLAKRPKTEM